MYKQQVSRTSRMRNQCLQQPKIV